MAGVSGVAGVAGIEDVAGVVGIEDVVGVAGVSRLRNPQCLGLAVLRVRWRVDRFMDTDRTCREACGYGSNV